MLDARLFVFQNLALCCVSWPPSFRQLLILPARLITAGAVSALVDAGVFQSLPSGVRIAARHELGGALVLLLVDEHFVHLAVLAPGQRALLGGVGHLLGLGLAKVVSSGAKYLTRSLQSVLTTFCIALHVSTVGSVVAQQNIGLRNHISSFNLDIK